MIDKLKHAKNLDNFEIVGAQVFFVSKWKIIVEILDV